MNDKIIANIRKQAQNNWDEGKARQFELKKELVLQGNLVEAANLNVEWRTVNWYREDGWNDSIKREIQKLGYRIIADDPECINVLMEWKGPSTTPP